ncbi:MAG: hypothetical protein ACRD3D_01340 [Terriglobia bacterium]
MEFRIRAFALAIAPSFLAAAATIGVVVGLSESGVLEGLRPVTVLSAEIVAGGLVAATIMWVSDRQLKDEITTSHRGFSGAGTRSVASCCVKVQ